MEAEPGLGLSDDAYYSPTPIAAADELGKIVEVNVALETLLGRSADSYIDRQAATLARVLSPPYGLPRGEPGHPAGIGGGYGNSNGPDVRTAESVFASHDFGPVRLHGTAVGRHDPSWPRQGTTYYWQVEDAGAGPRFRAVFLERLKHRLTWELYAASYDRILPAMRYYRLVLRRHRKALHAPGVRRIADLGAGTGNFVELLLRDGHEVWAVEPNRAMLARLYAKPWAGDARLTVLRRSAEDLRGLDDDSFDGVSILLALYDMERPAEALREAVRVLRPGGTIVVTEPKERFDIKIILARCELRLKRLGVLDALRADMDRVNTANHRLDPSSRPSRSPLRAEAVAQMLEGAGFADVTLRDSHFRQCATVVATKP